jgi:ribosomal protein S27AE
MGRRRTLPAVDEIRCPRCRSIDWFRLGERITEVPAGGDGRSMAQHANVDENGPWDWTCQRCGQAIKAGSHLDHLVGKVQSVSPVRTGVLAWLGDLREQLQSAGTGAQAAIATGVVVVAVAALAALALQPTPTGERQANSPSPRTTPAAAASPVSDLATIVTATDAAALAGQRVQLHDARVQSVTGDVTFWIGDSMAQRVFVVLEERTQGEGAVTVRDDDRIDLRGTMRRTPVEGAEIPAEDRGALADEVLYVVADWVTVVTD